MSTRIRGPLHQLQVDGDELKKEIDQTEKIVRDLVDSGETTEDLKSTYQHCIDMKIRVGSMLLEGHQLQQVNEQIKVQNFETKKKEEIKRIEVFQNRLNNLMDEIETVSQEKEHLRSLRDSQKHNGHFRTNPVSQDADEDGDDEEDYSGEEDKYDEDDPGFYEVVHPFEAERDTDLTIEPGDIVTVIRKQEDGWWDVRNEDGKCGMVPSTFLEECEDVEEEEEEEEESVLQEDTGEPATQAEVSPTRSGKDLWKGIKDAVNEPTKTDVTDVLSALGAIPAGFRPSTLSRLLYQGDEYTLKNAVLPAFTDSNTGLRDLHWDPTLNQIRPVLTRVLRSCRLWSCRMIPLPGSGVEVLSRHVRLALFDGTNVMSNIHTVRATCNASSPKLWTFSPRVTGILPSLLDGNCIVRSDVTHSGLGILFELGITYIRTPPRKVVHYSDGPAAKYSDSEESGGEGGREKVVKTGERAELSCGWVFLKLFDEQGNAIPNKTYELVVNGGTPFEKGVEVDPSISRRASTNRFRALLAANKQPRLIVKMGTPNNTKKKFLNLLPANIVLPASYCELVSYFRRILADTVIRDRLSTRDADPVSCPVLSSFPKALMLTDVMDAVRMAWMDKSKTFRRGDRRDKENMKSQFRSVFLETGYLFLHSVSLPPPHWGHPQVEQERWQKIFQQVQAHKSATNTSTGIKIDTTTSVLKSLLSPNIEHAPFDMEELNFNLLDENRKSLHGEV